MTNIKESENTKNIPMHFVCTIEEAKELTKKHENFWVLNCGCREKYGKGNCPRSRIDVCLLFEEVDSPWGSNLKEISTSYMEGIIKEAEDKFLVARPFRDEDTRSYAQGHLLLL